MGNVVGICIQLAGVTCSACKYVFAHSVMQKCKKDLGTFAFLFWIDVLILFILVPWAVINGELITIVSDPETPLEWFNLLFTAVLGGIRFFSQLLVLRVSTATTLSCANLAVGLVCGSLITLSSAGIYTYFKISKVLENDAGCVKKNEDFKSMCGTMPCCKGSPEV